MLVSKKRNTLEMLDHCKWSPEIIAVPLKYMTASAP